VKTTLEMSEVDIADTKIIRIEQSLQLQSNYQDYLVEFTRLERNAPVALLDNWCNPTVDCPGHGRRQRPVPEARLV
jgi:hypothetical protein